MSSPQLILFTYDMSVYGRKIEWYLSLRGLKYSKNITRNRLPREQLAELGIHYRRIPILAIGKDIYCDTRLIIDKLEQLFPENRLSSSEPFNRGIEYLVESWANDAGPFGRTAQLIPPTSAAMKDEKWVQDRSEMSGNAFTPDMLAYIRPEALAHARWFLERVENSMLSDGRDYMLGTSKPSLADVHVVWVYDWLFGMATGMPEFVEKDIISSELYPRTTAWVSRFRQYVEGLQERNGQPEILNNEDAIARILSSDYYEAEDAMDPKEPLKLSKGQLVEVWPSDSGSKHHDQGKLVSIGVKEVVIESVVPDGKGNLRLHFPRINFRIAPAQNARL
jgi:glutathione S-transferase